MIEKTVIIRAGTSSSEVSDRGIFERWMQDLVFLNAAYRIRVVYMTVA